MCMSILEKIKSIRMFKGLTQENMAEQLGYASVNSYAKLERGEVELTINKLEEIAQILGVRLQILFGLSDGKVIPITGSYNVCIGARKIPPFSEHECAVELEKSRLLLQEREREVEHLKEHIRLLNELVALMKSSTPPTSEAESLG